MAYRYLLDLYEALDGRIAQVDDERCKASLSSAQAAYLEGRISCLQDFRSFLQDHYHQKLPRRIQKMSGK